MPNIQLNSFTANYTLNNQSIFKMGAENPELKMAGGTQLTIQQHIAKNKIHSTIITHSQSLTTENSELTPIIDEVSYIAKISKELNLSRNIKGDITYVNKKDLIADWELWKKNEIQNQIPEEHKQKKFIKKYEAGLDNYEQGLKNSLSHALMLPPIHFPSREMVTYQSPIIETKSIVSKLIDDLNIHYSFYPTYTKEEENLLIVGFESKVYNQHQIAEKIEPLYNQSNQFVLENYQFKITAKYCIQPSTYKIHYAELKLTEQMHADLWYQVNITLSENDIDVEPLKSKIYKTHNGNIYSREEWETLSTTQQHNQTESPIITNQFVIENQAKQNKKDTVIILSLIIFIIGLLIIAAVIA